MALYAKQPVDVPAEAREMFTVLRINGGLFIRPREMPGPREQHFPVRPLSPRELEVLRQVAEGCSNKEIGENLNISERTVKNHLASIMDKLDAKDRTHSVILALRQGWLSI